MGLYVIPAFQAERTIAAVVSELVAAGGGAVVVVDDGSTDETALRAEAAGALVLRHATNLGKGAALATALRHAEAQGVTTVVTLDADGQHPPREAARLLAHEAPSDSLLLGVRDLAGAGAPVANRRSNAFSNMVLSWFAGQRLLDTQCGLRRYPVKATLELGARPTGFAFEADVVLRAARRGVPIVHVPCQVIYPADRTTHFDSVRDPARIVARVVWTWLTVPHHRWLRRWAERALLFVCALWLVSSVAHLGVDAASRFTPPAVSFEHRERVDVGVVRTVGAAQALRRQGIWEVLLSGQPEEIGWAHARLLQQEMEVTERSLLGTFDTYVPSAWARTLLLDLARFRYRNVDRGMSTARLRELAATAAGFAPDPFAEFLPTYQRFVYLNALYDISLSLEHSPLLGCTTFTSRQGGETGGPLLARVFDFEVHDVFDRQKVVFFVREAGGIPFASVAWPGLVGVVSGMNAEGVGIVVHGARGGEFSTVGEPVVHAVRRVLTQARTTADAVKLFDERPAMVSHLIVVQDATGRAARLERAPGRAATLIELPSLAVVTNHFEGPLADDPRNQRVMRETSTLARRARGDALIAARGASPQTGGTASGRVGARELAAFLRDRRDASGRPLPPGDRRAIDADIATHAVILDTGARVLWVSQGPHLSGDFVRYDLADLVARSALLPVDVQRPTLSP